MYLEIEKYQGCVGVVILVIVYAKRIVIRTENDGYTIVNLY